MYPFRYVNRSAQCTQSHHRVPNALAAREIYRRLFSTVFVDHCIHNQANEQPPANLTISYSHRFSGFATHSRKSRVLHRNRDEFVTISQRCIVGFTRCSEVKPFHVTPAIPIEADGEAAR